MTVGVVFYLLATLIINYIYAGILVTDDFNVIMAIFGRENTSYGATIIALRDLKR